MNLMKKSIKPIVSLILLYIGYMLLFADRTVMNISMAYIGKEFQISPAALGATASAFFLGYTLMQIPGGIVTDILGSKKTVIISLILWSLLTAFTGLATSLMTLVVIRFLFGLAEGPYPSAALKQISEEYDKSDRSQATSVTISSNYAGAAIAPLIIVPIIASHGWRVSFYFLGILGLILVGPCFSL